MKPQIIHILASGCLWSRFISCAIWFSRSTAIFTMWASLTVIFFGIIL